jgi:hypothetical protein
VLRSCRYRAPITAGQPFSRIYLVSRLRHGANKIPHLGVKGKVYALSVMITLTGCVMIPSATYCWSNWMTRILSFRRGYVRQKLSEVKVGRTSSGVGAGRVTISTHVHRDPARHQVSRTFVSLVRPQNQPVTIVRLGYPRRGCFCAARYSHPCQVISNRERDNQPKRQRL